MSLNGAAISAEIKNGSEAAVDIRGNTSLGRFSLDGRIAARGTGSPEAAVDLTVSADLRKVKHFAGLAENLGGEAAMTVSVQGLLNNPEAVLTGTVENPVLPGSVSGRSIRFKGHLADRKFEIDSLTADMNGGLFEIIGGINLAGWFPKGFLHVPDSPANLSYELAFTQKNGNFRQFRKQITGIAGRFSTEGRVAGTGIFPETMQASYRMAMKIEDFRKGDADTGRPGMDMTAGGHGRIQNGVLTFERFAAESGKNRLAIDGTCHLVKKEMRLTAELDIPDLPQVVLPSGIDPPAGNFRADLTLTHDFNGLPLVTGTLRADALGVAGITADSVLLEGTITPAGNLLFHRLDIGKGDAVVHAAGSAALFEEGGGLRPVIAADFSLSGQEITPRRLFSGTEAILPPGFQDSRFGFDLDVWLQCDRSDLSGGKFSRENPIPVRKVTADLDLKEKRLYSRMDDSLELTASFDAENSQYAAGLLFSNADPAIFLGPAGVSGISGEIDGSLTSTGAFSREPVRGLVRPLETAVGNVSVDLKVGGTFRKPDVRGTVAFEDVGVLIPGTGMVASGESGGSQPEKHHGEGIFLSEVNGEIRGDTESLVWRDISGNLGRGTFTLNGKAALDGFMPSEVTARFEAADIRFEVPDVFESVFSADLTFTGGREDKRVSGTLTLIDGGYYKDFEIDIAGALTGNKRAALPAGGSRGTGLPLIDRTSLDIDVDYKAPFVVDNNLVYAGIEPDIALTGTPAAPVVTGRAGVTEGTVRCFKNTFDITRGVIDFVNPYAIDPSIDITAETTVREWTITLQVSGKKDDLKFTLNADPDASHEDILSLLIAGRTTSELAEDGTGPPTGILANEAASFLEKKVEKTTPLDTFRLDYAEEESSETPEVTVEIGKKLSERLEVKYMMERDEQEIVHTNTAEYEFLENLMLKIFNDSKGDFGAEVSFGLEFR